MTEATTVRPRRSPILTVVPLLVVVGTFIAIVQRVAKPLTNTDTYFHLRMGAEFLDGWSAREPGSVSEFATADWVPTQWLGQVGYALFERWFGLPGVAWLSGALILTFALTVFLVARSHGSVLVASLITPLVIAASAPFLSARPQVVSYVFVVLTTAGWLRYRDGGRLPWWLIPVTWLWAMVHGMWPVGPALGLVVLAGTVLDRTRGSVHGSRRRALLVPALSVVAAGLTPVGPAIYGAVARVGSISEYFAEWGPTDFTELSCALSALLVVLWLVVALRSGQVGWTELLLVGLAGAWMAYSSRTVPVGTAIMVPLLAQRLQQALPQREPSPRPELLTAVGGYLVALVALAVAVPFTSDEPLPVPAAIDAELRALPAGTGLLNEWNEGGHDMWRYPDLQIVIHGYGDMFTDDELERNVDILDLEPEWDEQLADLGVTHALLYTKSPLVYALSTDKGWEVVAKGKKLSYLVAPDDWPAGSAG